MKATNAFRGNIVFESECVSKHFIVLVLSPVNLAQDSLRNMGHVRDERIAFGYAGGVKSFYFRNFENYRKIMEEFGDADKKIWFTEFGWASSPNPAQEYAYAKDVSQEQQATYLVEAIEMARSSGFVDGVFVWNLNFAPNAAPEDSQGKRAFSIVNPNWTPRPAYDALRTMIK